MKLRRLGHVNLSVDDVARAQAFYGEVLRLEPAPRPPETGRPGCWFRLGDVELHISQESGADNAGSGRHVAFEVEGLDELRGALVAAGVPVAEGRPAAGMRRFFARDPAGNRLELYELLP